MMNPTIDSLVLTNMTRIARDALRYGALKRIKPNQFEALYKSSFLGKSFDEMVDMLVVEMHTDKFNSRSLLVDKPTP